MLVVDDDRGHRVDAGLGVEPLARARLAANSSPCRIARAILVELRLRARGAPAARGRRGSGHRCVAGLEQRLLERDRLAGSSIPAQCSRRCASKVFQTRERPCSRNSKPTAALRWRIASRAWALLLARAAVFLVQVLEGVLAFGAICGLSSKGWKRSSAWMSGATLRRAASRAPRPTAHQGS